MRTKPKQQNVDRDKVKRVIEAAFREQFPRDTVDVSDGYEENIHLVVVSRQFDELPLPERHDLMWHIIDSTNLTEEEKQLISLVHPLGINQIK